MKFYIFMSLASGIIGIVIHDKVFSKFRFMTSKNPTYAFDKSKVPKFKGFQTLKFHKWCAQNFAIKNKIRE